jgi:ribosomal protein L29
MRMENMQHDYINAHNLVDRYVMGKLSADECDRFEEHFMDCARCAQQIEMTQKLHRGLQRAVTTNVAHTHIQSGWIGWLARLSRRRRVALLASALVLLIVLPATWLIREIVSARHAWYEEKRAAARWQQQVEKQQRAADELNRKLQATEDELAALRAQNNIQRLPTHPDTFSEMARLRQPQVNVPIVRLMATRSADPSRPANEVNIPRSSALMVFSLELVGEVEGKIYRATIRTIDGRFVWRGEALRPNPSGVLTMSFPSHFFRPGDYFLRLEEVDSHGPSSLVASYSFRAIKP